jgi:hypothetical protein
LPITILTILGKRMCVSDEVLYERFLESISNPELRTRLIHKMT